MTPIEEFKEKSLTYLKKYGMTVLVTASLVFLLSIPLWFIPQWFIAGMVSVPVAKYFKLFDKD